MTTLQGWSTCPEYDHPPAVNNLTVAFPFLTAANACGSGSNSVCQTCGTSLVTHGNLPGGGARCVHGDLVRSVVLGEDFVLSGSYDLSIKVGFFSGVNLSIRPPDHSFVCRFGTARRVDWSLTSPEATQAGYFASEWIAPRYAQSTIFSTGSG